MPETSEYVASPTLKTLKNSDTYSTSKFHQSHQWSFYRCQNSKRQMCKVASNKTTNKHYDHNI